MAEGRLMRMRSPFARAIYNNIADQHEHKENLHKYWYTVKTEHIPAEICTKFIESHQDEEACHFYENCFEKSEWIFTHMFHAFSRPILHMFMTQTSANGILNRGSMFVFSNAQFLTLLGKETDWKAGRLLDLGAGDGMVTANMDKHFEEVYVTEMSPPMRHRLKARGYSVLEIEEWSNGTLAYNVISCLNLLDRCDQPITLLHNMKTSLKPNGKIIVAVVLPFRPYVETNADHNPSETINMIGDTFEDQLSHLVEHVFEPAGFSLVSFTRLPYLCEGDINRSFYKLDDAVLVLEPSTSDS